MRTVNLILVTLIVTGPLSLKLPSNPITVKGHVINNYKDSRVYVAGLSMFVKVSGRIVSQSTTDSNGDFSLRFTPTDKSSDFYCAGVGTDTLLLDSIERIEKDNVELTFHIPNAVKKDAFGKVYCPKCKRTNKVYPICYCDPPITVRRISSTGDTTYSRIYKGEYQAGTDVVGAAKYYCDRDKVQF
ncbi:hypothetical protein EXU85_22535 [Spirosoma sp. KCTC 42546]|uniref:hypothetical protein n=1 Tax=Spirosoma sp. KCTC 42546 TaxID=2520506 RepID=UPI00115B0A3B|nr:hypothetical protein [Spirosoma sp. KCTC 42546]QDK81234.1 hypothetical protein EXU85_22535 [Spirosoma sp. KCTC 42546]